MREPSQVDLGVIDSWCAWYRAGDASPGTIRLRRHHLMRLARVANLLDICEDDLVSWMDSQTTKPASRKSVMASVRSFYSWAVRTGVSATDPTVGLRKITTPDGLPKPISELALERALTEAGDEARLMLILGAYAGLRRAEIAAVHSDDITGMGLVVKGKGRKVRRIPIHPLLAESLIGVRGWAFPSPVVRGGHVQPDYVGDRLDRVLPEPWTPHSLRHRFATQTYRACKDIRIVQQLLGHATIQTTVRYVMVDEDALTAAVLAVN